jgi:hypothetical protein
MTLSYPTTTGWWQETTSRAPDAGRIISTTDLSSEHASAPREPWFEKENSPDKSLNHFMVLASNLACLPIRCAAMIANEKCSGCGAGIIYLLARL